MWLKYYVCKQYAMSEESPKRNTLSNHANEAWGFPMVKHISYVCWIFAHKSCVVCTQRQLLTESHSGWKSPRFSNIVHWKSMYFNFCTDTFPFHAWSPVVFKMHFCPLKSGFHDSNFSVIRIPMQLTQFMHWFKGELTNLDLVLNQKRWRHYNVFFTRHRIVIGAK